MTTIHLTDTQRDTFAACGLIVIEGEQWEYQDERNKWHNGALVAPEGWRILTEPCDTCNGFGAKYWTDYPSGATVASCGVCGWDVEMQQNRWVHVDPDQYRRYHEGRDRPFKLDHTTYPRPCSNCVGGLRVVTLTATCPNCHGTKQGCIVDADDIGPHCGRCGGRNKATGVVTLGRFTIPALLPVSESSYEPDGVHVWVTGSIAIATDGDPRHLGRTLTLDPLPRPGQFIARPEPVTPNQ